jgi:heme oxygenase (biliverdin-producing, ferredoxin)
MSVTANRRSSSRLPERLWAATRAHHDQVRGTPFMIALAARRLPWRAYADWLSQLYFIHESLGQAEAIMPDDSGGPTMSRSARVSLPSLASDLCFLHGAGWAHRIVASPPTTVYCTHLRDTAVREASGFVAHHYARHIEDLYAAADLAAAVAVAYGLDDAGCQFLRRGDTQLTPYQNRYHELLNRPAWSLTEADRLLTHAARVHRMHLEIIGELSRSWT